MVITHGGNVAAAARQFDIPLQQWIDLSTGISPWHWPVPTLPAAVWRTLPEADQRLESAAAQYYGCSTEAVLSVPGSQYALQYTPALLPRSRVAIPQRGYAEHRLAWIKAGHQIVNYLNFTELEGLIADQIVDHALVINPNNPTGEFVSRQQLESLWCLLNQSKGYLIIDEAFVDHAPEQSLATLCPRDGLIVYRSVGKFFGLAGLRLGFMLAQPVLCRQLAAEMPPWLLSHPARWIGICALSDSLWQQEQRIRLADSGAAWWPTLHKLIPQLRFTDMALFSSGTGDPAFCQALHQALARRALWIRIFDTCDGQGRVRFGLPLPTEQVRVEEIIVEAVKECARKMA